MQLDKVKDAQAEARKFLQRCDELLKASEPAGDYLWGNKHTAAVRRQSMELTRSLSELRKPN